MAGEAIYRDMNQATLDAAYNNAEAVTDSAEIVADWERRGEVARAAIGVQTNLSYGGRERNAIDYFSSGKHGAPLLAFIHGGYWLRNGKETFSFASSGPLEHGIDVAHIGYTLAPDATLTEIAAEIDAGLDYLMANASKFGFDTKRVIVSGWSAGGHLAAHVSQRDDVRAAFPISGLFELTPIQLCYVNDIVDISDEEVVSLSPIRHIAAGDKRYAIAVGGDELSELQKQSSDYADALKAAGHPVDFTMPPGRNHFTVMEELADPDGALTRMLVRLVAAIS